MIITKHISAANKIFNKKHPVAILQEALIKDGTCTISNMLVQYTFPVPIKGHGCIDWLDLRAALKAGVTSGTVTVPEDAPEGTAVLYCGTTRIELPASSPTPFPLFDLAEDPAFIPSAMLNAKLLTDALAFVDVDNLDKERPNSRNGVLLRQGHVAATNGSVVYLRQLDTSGEKSNALVLPEAVLNPSAVAAIQPFGAVKIRIEQVERQDLAEQEGPSKPRHCLITQEDARIVSRVIDDIYPDVFAVFPWPSSLYRYADPLEGANRRAATFNRPMIDAGLLRLEAILTDTSTVRLGVVNGHGYLQAQTEFPVKRATVDLGEVGVDEDVHWFFSANNLELALSTDKEQFRLEWFPRGLGKLQACLVNGNLLMQMSYDDDLSDPLEE